MSTLIRFLEHAHYIPDMYGNSRSEVNNRRLIGTLELEMAHSEGARIGIGDMDDDRLSRLIYLIAETKDLPRTPSVSEVFDRSFHPDAKIWFVRWVGSGRGTVVDLFVVRWTKSIIFTATITVHWLLIANP
ncbi:MAG: hypothetical protein ABJZ90_18880 [Paracoccaceae bacterium]